MHGASSALMRSLSRALVKRIREHVVRHFITEVAHEEAVVVLGPPRERRVLPRLPWRGAQTSWACSSPRLARRCALRSPTTSRPPSLRRAARMRAAPGPRGRTRTAVAGRGSPSWLVMPRANACASPNGGGGGGGIIAGALTATSARSAGASVGAPGASSSRPRLSAPARDPLGPLLLGEQRDRSRDLA